MTKYLIYPEVGRFLRKSKMAESRFSRLVNNDPRLVHELKNGRKVGDRVAVRIRQVIRENSG